MGMIKLAKKLKKEKVNIDIVNFGEDEANTDVLNKFVTTINGKEGTGSHLVTLTTDTGKILAKLHQVAPTGDMRFISGIKIAHLALKHRQGKNHKTRIVAFVGSPIEADEKEMIKLAKKLKKEKV